MQKKIKNEKTLIWPLQPCKTSPKLHQLLSRVIIIQHQATTIRGQPHMPQWLQITYGFNYNMHSSQQVLFCIEYIVINSHKKSVVKCKRWPFQWFWEAKIACKWAKSKILIALTMQNIPNSFNLYWLSRFTIFPNHVRNKLHHVINLIILI